MGQKMSTYGSDTIVALATPHGVGGIAVVRLSGPDAFSILRKCWKGKDIDSIPSHAVRLGWITDADGEAIDNVVLTVYRAPGSYTGENVAEISCHGSLWIQQAVVNRLIECGARAAEGGEFTRRAFMNGRLDLAQAEGVADMIAASSKAAARLAATQLKGEFSKKLDLLRQDLVDLGSLLELELDFSEEEVEFADRSRLIGLSKKVKEVVDRLADSYRAGNAFKNGVPVVIAGAPNVGKSTLLNALTGEERAIVSDIPGTTRDIIEDTVEIDGILFRFYDTAGLRDTDDPIESIGVDRARRKLSEAAVILHLTDVAAHNPGDGEISIHSEEAREGAVLNIVTKSDLLPSADNHSSRERSEENPLYISALTGNGIPELKKKLVEIATADYNPQQELIVTNARHYEALRLASESLSRLVEALENDVPTDFLAQDLREATHHLGSITGAVTSDDLLHTIFSRYCIGKETNRHYAFICRCNYFSFILQFRYLKY